MLALANLTEQPEVNKIRCSFTTVDLFVEKNKTKVDFIKCDVEGAEFLVFKGAQETLRRDKPVIFTEMLRKWSAPFNYHPNDMIKFFADLSYDCFVIEDGERLQRFTTVDEMTVETNYIFCHRDKIGEIGDLLVLPASS